MPQPTAPKEQPGNDWLAKRVTAFWDFEALGGFFEAPLDHRANTAWRAPRLSDEEPG